MIGSLHGVLPTKAFSAAMRGAVPAGEQVQSRLDEGRRPGELRADRWQTIPRQSSHRRTGTRALARSNACLKMFVAMLTVLSVVCKRLHHSTS